MRAFLQKNAKTCFFFKFSFKIKITAPEIILLLKGAILSVVCNYKNVAKTIKNRTKVNLLIGSDHLPIATYLTRLPIVKTQSSLAFFTPSSSFFLLTEPSASIDQDSGERRSS